MRPWPAPGAQGPRGLFNGGVLVFALEKRFPGFRLEVALEVQAGEVLALLGPSGSGKSTLLKLIAGLLPPDRGFVRLGPLDLTPLPPEKRGVGFLFQDYALFPHLSVAENIAFPLVEARWPKARREERVQELLSRMELSPHARKRPEALSGGEKQRVALARALAARPRLLLLDEPSLGLAPLMVREIYRILAALKGEGVTLLVVEQNAKVALELADRGLVLEAGEVALEGSAKELWQNPKVVEAYLGLKREVGEG